MASNMRRVTKIVKRDKKYKKEFDDIYENGVNSDNIIDAIAVFESALTTPNARFDKYLRGDVHALSKQEKKGYKRFIELGCINCHNGVNVGGNMYQKAGIMSNLSSNNKYLGRYNVTKREKDKYVYKVPSLRNIELTAPYFHDGSVNSLREAVYKMGIYQLGIVIGDKDLDDIVAFLKTLTGQSPKILEK
jgi:cytochrome c peroxidase